MCGIAGILSAAPASDGVCDAAVASLARSLRHRGPDDEGRFVSGDGRAAFVHARLAILDLSPAGHQPMHSPDGRLTVTFNGEIYNFLELRRDLEQSGERFSSRSDTEVLLRLYQRLGPECVTRLRGMFAFAIWDDLEKTCFLARDLFGIKPLYYHDSGDRLLFASEVRALLDTGLIPRRLDPAGVAGYFRNGSVQEPDTLVRDVRSLPAGHAVLWKSGAVQPYQYRAVQFPATPAPDAGSILPEVRAALDDSVAHHFLSDVPVGIFLSGGIDSTALLALASHDKSRDIRTFSMRFAEPEFDEGDVARRTAAHFGSTHAEWELDGTTARALFDDFLGCLDQPSIDGFNTFVVSKFAHDQGMKVVLSGLGGDELFGGYPSFSRVPDLLALGRRVGALGPVGVLVGAGLQRFAPADRWRRVGQFLGQEPDVLGAYHAFRAVFPSADADRLAYGVAEPSPASRAAAWTPQPTVADDVSAMELRLYMRNQLLRDSDAMSMAWGLELRVPFLDQALFAQLSSVPAATRIRPGKQLLLDAVPEIPAWVVGQPKRGFVFPFQQWLDADWKDTFRGATVKSGVEGRTWYQKWAIFVFEHWCRRSGVS
jgi:asparagine synthase (glutamine-hydrolysing)